jgi:uncharacterized membrane protein
MGWFDLFAKEHPAFVHVPLGLVVCLPIMMAAALRSRYPQTWRRMAFRVALLAEFLSLLTMASGLGWARQLALVPRDALLPVITSQGQTLQRILRLHELAAVAGWALGLVTLLLLRRSYHQPERKVWTLLGLAGTVAWASMWGLGGRLGGVLVFGDAQTNKAAAAAIEAHKADAEADLPVRALDYASLEPAQAIPFRSKGHGGRLARVWVTASGSDAYAQGRALPVGAYAVLTTVLDASGTPGPLFMREIKADGSQAFATYWGRVPEALRSESGGEEFLYRRSPDPALKACAQCHTGGR